MNPSPRLDAQKEPEAPQDLRREYSDNDIADKLETVRVAALEVQQSFQDLQRRSQEKATPPVPAPTKNSWYEKKTLSSSVTIGT